MGIFARIKKLFGGGRSETKRPGPFAPRSGSRPFPSSTRLEEEAGEDEAYDILRGIDRDEESTIDDQPWHSVVSSNVDRARYAEFGRDAGVLQIIFKSGAMYEYAGVHPEDFRGLLTTHSPGQWVWYVIRAYYGDGRALSKGHGASAPAPPRFEGRPFAVPEEVQRRHEGHPANDAATGGKSAPPPV